MHSVSWRVGDYHIRMTVLGNKGIVKHHFHISHKEIAVGNIVSLGIGLGISDSFRNTLHTNNFIGVFRNKLGNGTRSGVQVIHGFVAGKPCKVAGYLV